METLTTHTRGEDIFLAVKKACIQSDVDLKNLRGICTDGAPAMTGKQQGLVARMSDYLSKEHDNILKDVNRVISFIQANALNHRQFLELLHTSESFAEVILYHTDVRWLPQGETSHRVLLLRKEIVEFYSMKNKDCPLLNNDFLTSLAFLVDLLTHVNYFNQKSMQRNNSLPHAQKNKRLL
ncbi:hypothetical protein J437_LFUL012904 [Ladona fulva]|uniref:Uncharacterized protein n=1 Tax=Ladona fulva TaxID=123851 RepID=A0A8K0KD83_LADFU|nr:hypothetical protein J437_LFUL012904 [Ladona fulva]